MKEHLTKFNSKLDKKGGLSILQAPYEHPWGPQARGKI